MNTSRKILSVDLNLRVYLDLDGADAEASRRIVRDLAAISRLVASIEKTREHALSADAGVVEVDENMRIPTELSDVYYQTVDAP